MTKGLINTGTRRYQPGEIVASHIKIWRHDRLLICSVKEDNLSMLCHQYLCVRQGDKPQLGCHHRPLVNLITPQSNKRNHQQRDPGLKQSNG